MTASWDRGQAECVGFQGWNTLLVAIVKVETFVEAAAVCKQRGLAIKFVFIGQSARAVEGIVFRLARLVAVS